MMYKTEQEVLEVISLGKPLQVVDMFLESYLQGVEYAKWAEGKDLEDTVDVVVGQDEDGNDIIEKQLANVYEPIDVAANVIEWKISNYAVLRKASYPDIAEYLDAMVKGDAVAEQEYKDKCLAVKTKYPKV